MSGPAACPRPLWLPYLDELDRFVPAVVSWQPPRLPCIVPAGAYLAGERGGGQLSQVIVNRVFGLSEGLERLRLLCQRKAARWLSVGAGGWHLGHWEAKVAMWSKLHQASQRPSVLFPEAGSTLSDITRGQSAPLIRSRLDPSATLCQPCGSGKKRKEGNGQQSSDG